MKITKDKQKIIKLISKEKKLGFVPTMGALHKGHISLIKKSTLQCNKTVVSIFINKPQFNKSSDFRKYPRSLKKDIEIIKKLKVDFLYLPKNKDIYPNGPNKKIKIHYFAKKLCGKFRPNHFKSVVDVIERFVKILSPAKIYLGNKDMQQLKIVENYINNKYSYLKVVPCKTIREKNGIAYSSRNRLLSIKEKMIASTIYKILYKNKLLILKNKLPMYEIKKKY